MHAAQCRDYARIATWVVRGCEGSDFVDGTAGVDPYLHGEPEAAGTCRRVRAQRRLDGCLHQRCIVLVE
jgi:hypothetical protein